MHVLSWGGEIHGRMAARMAARMLFIYICGTYMGQGHTRIHATNSPSLLGPMHQLRGPMHVMRGKVIGITSIDMDSISLGHLIAYHRGMVNALPI
jgi:hypothetical protein